MTRHQKNIQGSTATASNLSTLSLDNPAVRTSIDTVQLAFIVFSFALYFVSGAALFVAAHSGITGIFRFFKPEVLSVYSGLFQVILFGWLYGLVLHVWRRVGIDHIHLMNFNRNTATDETGIWTMASALSCCLFASITGYVVATLRLPQREEYALYPATISPLVVVVAFLIFIFAPIGTLYPASRLRLAKVLGQVLSAPAFGVDLVHIIVTDAMTSACLTLWQLEYGICFYFRGEWLDRTYDGPSSSVCDDDNKKYFKPIMYVLPFWLRFVQCWYRAWATRHEGGWKHTQNYVNAGKYLSAILVVFTSSMNTDFIDFAHPYNWSMWRFLWLAAIVIKTLYCYIWDITMDWDLAIHGAKAKRWLLRPHLIYDNHYWVYYAAMVTNFFARCAWSLAISPHAVPARWSLALAMVEILRRAQWKIFRMENSELRDRASGGDDVHDNASKQRLLSDPTSDDVLTAAGKPMSNLSALSEI